LQDDGRQRARVQQAPFPEAAEPTRGDSAVLKENSPFRECDLKIGVTHKDGATIGRKLAESVSRMAARKTHDRRPGPLPEIHADGDSVTFSLPIPEVADGVRLILRCDAAGEVWASIVSTPKYTPTGRFTAGE
jgi:hypothetical protein